MGQSATWGDVRRALAEALEALQRLPDGTLSPDHRAEAEADAKLIFDELERQRSFVSLGLSVWRHPTWKPGDPCPHCAKGQIKGVRAPFCLACKRYVDERPSRGQSES